MEDTPITEMWRAMGELVAKAHEVVNEYNGAMAKLAEAGKGIKSFVDDVDYRMNHGLSPVRTNLKGDLPVEHRPSQNHEKRTRR